MVVRAVGVGEHGGILHFEAFGEQDVVELDREETKGPLFVQGVLERESLKEVSKSSWLVHCQVLGLVAEEPKDKRAYERRAKGVEVAAKY